MKAIKLLATAALVSLAIPAAFAEDQTTPVANSEQAPLNPGAVAAAKTTVDFLFPLGTYEKMMKGTMDQMMDSMLSSISGMTVRDMAGVMGQATEEMSEEERAETLGEAASKADPYFEERMRISTKIIMDETVKLMTKMEPEIRTSLTNIYARKFTASELKDMNMFFATKAGGKFASEYIMVFVDPEMTKAMMAMVPELMQSMPDIMKKVETATAHLPASKTPAMEAEDAMDSVTEAADASADDDTELPWEKQENWSDEDRKVIDELEKQYIAASDAYYGRLEAATENTKARMEKSKK